MKNAEPNTQRQLEWPNYGPVSVWTKRPSVSRQKDEQPQHERERSSKRSSVLWSALLTVLAASMTWGCTSLQTISVSTELPASLRESCPQLPVPQRTDGAYLFLWIRDVIALYNDCAERHDRTVEAIK